MYKPLFWQIFVTILHFELCRGWQGCEVTGRNSVDLILLHFDQPEQKWSGRHNVDKVLYSVPQKRKYNLPQEILRGSTTETAGHVFEKAFEFESAVNDV